MKSLQLSFNTRKSLCVQLGEDAGSELGDLLQALVARINELEQGKVDVIQSAPANSPHLAVDVHIDSK